MTKLRCCFCQQELEINDLDVQLLGCENQNCKHSIHYDIAGTKELWQELIRTRKALDVAKRRLMQIGYLNMSEHGLGSEKMMTDWCKTVALHGLKEIETALEQKEQQ